MPTSVTTSEENYRDGAIQEMLGPPPGWLLRSGLTSIMLVLVVLGALAYFIPYPNKVEAPFVLQTRVAPLEIKARAALAIDSIFVEDGATVSPGDTLYIYRSDADWRSVGQLNRNLEAASTDLEYEVSNNPLHNIDDRMVEMEQLIVSGDLPSSIQNQATDLLSLLIAYCSYLKTNGTYASTRSMEQEIARTRELSRSVNRQLEWYDAELDLQQKQGQRMQDLERVGSVSTQEAEQAQGAVVQARRLREGIIGGNIQNDLRITQLKQQILERRQVHAERLAEFDRQLRSKLLDVKAAINAYEEVYVVRAEEDGKISWQSSLRDKMNASPGDLLGYLLPTGHVADDIVARLYLSEIGQGEISLNQVVVLDLSGYPAREYGQLRGRLTYVAPIASATEQGKYVRMAEVALDRSLTTSYDRAIPFQYNLSGTARIITEKHTLLSRFLNQFDNFHKNT